MCAFQGSLQFKECHFFTTEVFTKIANSVGKVSFKKEKYNECIELIPSHGNITMIGTFSGWVCKNILSLMKGLQKSQNYV